MESSLFSRNSDISYMSIFYSFYISFMIASIILLYNTCNNEPYYMYICHLLLIIMLFTIRSFITRYILYIPSRKTKYLKLMIGLLLYIALVFLKISLLLNQNLCRYKNEKLNIVITIDILVNIGIILSKIIYSYIYSLIQTI